MKVTGAIDLLAQEIYFVSPQKPVSPVPLIFVTFMAEKQQVAYTTDNELKLARTYERQIKQIVRQIHAQFEPYLAALDQDQLLPLTEHLKQQAALVVALDAALAESTCPVIRIELAGSWPVLQTSAGRLDLAE